MPKLTRERINELALACGFKLKEQSDGSFDLNSYVFDFADAIVAELEGEESSRPKPIGHFPMFSNIKTVIGTDEDTGRVIVTPVDCSLVLIKRGDKFLGVSRKHDHYDIGLPGGKVEIGESFEEAAIRETLEETGFHIRLIDVQPYAAVADKHYCRTFLAEVVSESWNGSISGLEAPVVICDEPGFKDDAMFGFFDRQKFISGSFGLYNKDMFEHFGC